MALNAQGIAQALQGFPSTQAKGLQRMFELTDGAAAQLAAEGAQTAAEEAAEDAALLAVDATTAKKGVVKQAETQADSVAADVATLKTDFNALLAKLKAAGLME